MTSLAELGRASRTARCWVAETLPDAGPCDGVLQRAHLVRQQVLRREVGEGWRKAAADPRSWVLMCFKHHGQLDYSRTLKIPREVLPVEVEEFARKHGLLWWLDREYGTVPVDGVTFLRTELDASLLWPL